MVLLQPNSEQSVMHRREEKENKMSEEGGLGKVVLKELLKMQWKQYKALQRL